jgi:hypothetical protein
VVGHGGPSHGGLTVRLARRDLTLFRTGLVKVRVLGYSHCGAASAVVDGNVAVRYTVDMTFGPHSLDEKGFLIDQEALHQFFVTLGSDPAGWHESCELLAWDWGERFLTWVSVSNLHAEPRTLKFTLSPAPHLGEFSVRFDNI